MINPIIEQSILIGIPITCEFIPNRGFVYEIDGFYKSDTVSIEMVDGKLIAHARYDEKTEITEPRDIVVLNHEWWEFSKDRYDGWKEPSGIWKTLFEKFELI